jgi:hypothetical protein
VDSCSRSRKSRPRTASCSGLVTACNRDR